MSLPFNTELAVANSHEKFLMPILLDADHVDVKPGGFLNGIKITDVSSSAKYDEELPEIIRTIRAMISGKLFHVAV